VLASTSPALGAPRLDEESGVRRVCTASPAAMQARAERLRGEAAVVTANVLPNPELVLQHARTLSGASQQETTVSLAVSLGLGGRRFVLQDAAELRRRQAEANAHATLFEAALAFREAFVTAALDEARAQALAEQQRALDALTTTVQGLARGGESSGYAAARLRTQARLHARLLASARARAAASRALLEAWTGEEVALAPVALADLAGGAGTAAPRSAPLVSARIAGLEASAQASELEARAARRRWVPDVSISAGYRSLTDAVAGGGAAGGHGLALGLTVPLTLFDHGQGDAARAAADRAASLASAATLRRESGALAKASVTRLQILESAVADLEHAVAEAGGLQAKATALYAAGEGGITELLDAYRAVEEARLARIDLAEEIARARLARMRAAGTLFNSTLDKDCGGASGGAR
jgi:cobalt-zinc-cadmium efflux system outer membrane protein